MTWLGDLWQVTEDSWASVSSSVKRGLDQLIQRALLIYCFSAAEGECPDPWALWAPQTQPVEMELLTAPKPAPTPSQGWPVFVAPTIPVNGSASLTPKATGIQL